MALRRTLATEVFAEGVTLHAGVPVHMRLGPAPAGSGIRFQRRDLAGSAPIPALWSNVTETRLGTVLAGADGARVGVVEHLLAALSGAAIDDCLVELDAPEPPILDGDALSFLTLLDRAGSAETGAARDIILVRREIACDLGNATARLMPSATPELSCDIDFASAAIGRQSFDFRFSGESFRCDIAPARTFGFLAEAEQLRAAGYGRGASLDNTLVIDGDRLTNPGLKRFADEFVRHKILDAIGDLKLAGAPLVARYEAKRSSHSLNNALLKALFADPENFERVTE